MDNPAVHPEVFVHVRIIVGMVLGLGLARLVTGLTRFVQHPKRERIYFVHIGWVFFLLLAIIHFWWYEFRLSALHNWTFVIYFFLIFYAMLFVMLSAMLFPDRMDEYKGFEDYLQSRRRWFYGLLASIFAVDIVDTLIKGVEHFRALGIEYPIKQAVFAICAIVAIFVESKRYQAVFVSIAVVYEVFWILRLFDVLS